VSLLLGVDAGGTRTTAAVAGADGTILARAEAGPGRVRPGQASVAASAIFAAAKDALQRARVNAPARALVVGASGVAHPADRDALAAALEGSGLASRLAVTTDAEIALEAAFGERPGIIIIAGTGSVAWARLPNGRTTRAGGLGPVLGDRGSAHDLGREALRAIGVDLEMGLKLDLTKKVADHLGIPPGDFPRWSLGAAVADIAALAPLVLDVAASGDSVARSLVQQAARQLATLVAGMARQFAVDTTVHVACGGGLLTSRADYRALVEADVREFVPGVKVEKNCVDAVRGAISMAQRLGA
jgi:glucosamine kinase